MNKKVLYTGLYSDKIAENPNIFHCPLIEISPCDYSLPDIQCALTTLSEYTHILFTSKTAVEIFINHLPIDKTLLNKKIFIVVGQATAKALSQKGFNASIVADEESSEGIILKLTDVDLTKAYVLWPHSSLSRRLIPNYFNTKGIRFHECMIYETKSQRPNPFPNLNDFTEIMFTSPSTIDAFIENFGALPKEKKYSCIGPITKKYLLSLQK